MAHRFLYDVAFSFLSQDEGLALQLADAFEGRFSTFHYAQRQEVVAGTDGEATFNRVFESDARLVVVLHRVGWGARGMTQVEQTAIRNRAFEDGYDFTVWIPLDAAALPPWVPRTRIWIGLERWGLNGAASVIEARAVESGASPRVETALDHASRVQREHEREQERQTILHSQRGADAAKKEVAALQFELRTIVDSMGEQAPTLSPTYQVKNRRCAVIAGGATLTASWSQQYSNSLTQSSLLVMLWPFIYSLDWSVGLERHPSERREYELDVLPNGSFGWRQRTEPEQLHSSRDLANLLVKALLATDVQDGEWPAA